jgi:hypothetical protein
MLLRFVGRLWENMIFERAPGWETDRVERRPDQGDGEYQLELRNADGEVLVRVSPDVDFYRRTTIGPGEMLSADIVAYVPLRRDGRELVLRRGDLVVHREDVSPEPPQIDVNAVQRHRGERILISWRAEGPEGRDLTFDLLYVVNRERAFYLARRVAGLSYVAEIASYPGGQQIEIAVLASDGTRSSFSFSPAFEVEARPPQVIINIPLPDTVLPADQPVSLSGQATDVAGAPLPLQHLRWEVDGREVGRSRDVAMATDLEPGPHEAVLRYADPVGPDGEQRRTFVVAERNPEQQRFAELRATLE